MGKDGGNGEKWGTMGESGGKWGEMGKDGGKWGVVRNCQKYIPGKVGEKKMREIVRKWERNGRRMRQLGTNSPLFPIPFSSFFHGLATFPSRPFC